MRVTESSSGGGPTSWIGLKEQAKGAFERGDYETALTSYGAALHPDLYCPAAERQIMLSNIVACRLKIGGTAQAEAAVEAAKQVRIKKYFHFFCDFCSHVECQHYQSIVVCGVFQSLFVNYSALR